MGETKTTKAIFLDRDGTVIVEKHYLSDPELVELEAHALNALQQWHDQGYKLVIITNQSGIGRGKYTEADFWAVQNRLTDLLKAKGIPILASYFCPHTPDDQCDCRKPSPTLIQRASQAHAIDLTQSWMIGDKTCDTQAGKAAGSRTIMVRTGHGKDQTDRTTADFVVDHLGEAASIIEAQK